MFISSQNSLKSSNYKHTHSIANPIREPQTKFDVYIAKAEAPAGSVSSYQPILIGV